MSVSPYIASATNPVSARSDYSRIMLDLTLDLQTKEYGKALKSGWNQQLEFTLYKRGKTQISELSSLSVAELVEDAKVAVDKSKELRQEYKSVVQLTATGMDWFSCYLIALAHKDAVYAKDLASSFK